MSTEAAQQAASHTLDAAVAGAASKTTYAGAGMTVGGWLLSSEFAVLFGMALGLAGFIVNWAYKHKLTKTEIRLREEQAERDRIEHAARMGMYQ